MIGSIELLKKSFHKKENTKKLEIAIGSVCQNNLKIREKVWILPPKSRLDCTRLGSIVLCKFDFGEILILCPRLSFT